MKTGFHIDPIYARHRTPDGHPERLERIERLLELTARAAETGLTVLPATRRATLDELARVHERGYADAIASAAGRAGVMLDPDTFMSPDSYDVACHAAGGVLDLVDRVMTGELDNGFAAVRPPGHHAETDRAMGFCLFNNIAVAAAHAIERHGIERVLVVDWDVHHGNGTQQIFWDDPRVLFVSLHQFPFYPGTGSTGETGGANAPGCTVNIPLPGGCGDAEYLAAFRKVVTPVARAFAPGLVLVSAGFDAHASDPLGGMRMTADGFDAMAAEIADIARDCAAGRWIAVLEGGYNLDALGECVETVLVRMHEPDRPRPAIAGIRGSLDTLLAQVRSAHAAYWKF